MWFNEFTYGNNIKYTEQGLSIFSGDNDRKCNLTQGDQVYIITSEGKVIEDKFVRYNKQENSVTLYNDIIPLGQIIFIGRID